MHITLQLAILISPELCVSYHTSKSHEFFILFVDELPSLVTDDDSCEPKSTLRAIYNGNYVVLYIQKKIYACMLNRKSKNTAKAEPIINGCTSTPSAVQTELIHMTICERI